jgi:hypothetical protein
MNTTDSRSAPPESRNILRAMRQAEIFKRGKRDRSGLEFHGVDDGGARGISEETGIDANLLEHALRNAFASLVVMLVALLFLLVVWMLGRAVVELTSLPLWFGLLVTAGVPIATAAWTLIDGRD